MSWIKKLKTKIEMKFLDVIIAKIVDAFKAKNPKMFAIVAVASLGLNALCSSFTAWWERMLIVNPQYVEQVSGIQAIIPFVAEVGYWASGVAMILSGSRTTQILTQAKEKDSK